MARGGKRPGAGRKTNAYKRLMAELEGKAIEEAQEDAKYGLALRIQTMRDPEQDISLRLESADKIMDRVWGKARERMELDATAVLKAYEQVSPDDWPADDSDKPTE